MYTTIIHPIRKALMLSINEYCVMETIRANQAKKEFDYYCVLANEQIADELDVSKRTIINAKNALEQKGYIERKKNSTKCRVVDEVIDLFILSKNFKFMKMKDVNNYFASGKPFDVLNRVQNLQGEKVAPLRVKKLHPKGEKVAPNTNNTNNNTNRDTKTPFEILFKSWCELKEEFISDKKKRYAQVAFYKLEDKEQELAVKHIKHYLNPISDLKYSGSLENYITEKKFNKIAKELKREFVA